ncbi:hypothetical protein G6F65_014025 [Rhizopus arrhizus]|nr:hypothetical protein G6F65_014025 [Rhizopus arrhizus]
MRILLVEDDPDLSRALQSGLERQGVVADVVGSLAEAAIALRDPVHQLMLLDRQLPDGDGAGFVATARALRPNLAVIMLTAKGTLSDKVEGLDVGADDYLVKPVAIEELMARIRAVSRRPSAMVTPSLRLGHLEFDFESLQAQVEGQPLPLPRRQVLVLQALAMRQGRTVTRSALEAAVYGFDDEIQSNALDAHISKLRKALQQAGAGVEIHVIRGAFTVLFAVVALILTWGDKDSWGMDMFMAEAVAKAVHSEGGRLVLDEARWRRLDADAGGNLWFAAVDDKGIWLERGTIPAIHAPLLARLPTLGATELGSLVPPYLDVARVMIRNEDGRRITVMVGGAPKGGLLDGALMVLRLIGLWFFLPLIVVTLLVMPTVIHRAMRGVRRSAQQAKELDIGQPGARLDAQLVSTEVAPLVEAFNDAIDKVQQGYAARDKFLADAAHELRVPIAVVQARLSQLPQGELKSQLLTDVARLGNVAEHLLDLQRLDRNVGALQRLDLALLVREAAAELAPLVPGAGAGACRPSYSGG